MKFPKRSSVWHEEARPWRRTLTVFDMSTADRVSMYFVIDSDKQSKLPRAVFAVDLRQVSHEFQVRCDIKLPRTLCGIRSCPAMFV